MLLPALISCHPQQPKGANLKDLLTRTVQSLIQPLTTHIVASIDTLPRTCTIPWTRTKHQTKQTASPNSRQCTLHQCLSSGWSSNFLSLHKIQSPTCEIKLPQEFSTNSIVIIEAAPGYPRDINKVTPLPRTTL